MPDPASIRYYNPGAMWPGPSATAFGAIGYDTLNDGQSNKIARFPDAESGAAAQFDLLKRGYSGMTLSDAIRKWSGGNHWSSYANHISNATGLKPDSVLNADFLADPTKAIPLAKAMAQWEAGRPYPMTDEQWGSAHKRYLGGPTAAKPDNTPVTTGSLPSRTTPMPTDPVTGQWVPEQVIKSQYDRANQFWDTPRATSGLGALAEGLGGFFGMKERGSADDMVRKNQAGYKGAMDLAGKSSTSDEMARSLIASGIPALVERGTALLGQNMRTAEAQNTPAARAELAAKQQALKAAEQNFMHQQQMQPLQQELTRAQTEQARRKDAMERFKERLLFGEDADPATSGVKPMANQGEQPETPGVTLIDDKQAPQAQAIDEKFLTPLQWLRLQAKKDPLWVMNYMKQAEKDPSKAQEMMDQRRGKVTTGTKTKLEETLTGLTNMYGNLAQVQAQFKPEYLQVSNQAQQWWNAVRDKTGIEKLKLDPQEKTRLADFAAFRSSSIGVLNARLKELSGAAVTESEYKRIAAELPNPGTGIADGDSPTQFKAKMDSVLRMARLGIARAHFMAKNGFSGSVDDAAKQMPLDAVPQKMNEIGNKILNDLKISNPGATDEQLIPRAREEVARQFGMNV